MIKQHNIFRLIVRCDTMTPLQISFRPLKIIFEKPFKGFSLVVKSPRLLKYELGASLPSVKRET